MIKEPRICLFDLILALSEAVDLMNPKITNHHMQVAYIAHALALETGLGVHEQNELVLAGAIHDIGAFYLSDRLNTLEFEINDPFTHSESGYRLLRDFEPFKSIAKLVRFHHVPWGYGGGRTFRGFEVPLESHILHLADRVAVLVNRNREILEQSEEILQKVNRYSGLMFRPELLVALEKISEKEYFWLELISGNLSSILAKRVRLNTESFNLDDLLGIANLFSQIIDFRSHFTSTHSSGVSASAVALAMLCGFSENELLKMRIAGYLHDLGKLAVPTEILEKPGKLTVAERNVVRKHTYYTFKVLEPIEAMADINAWGAYHHERLTGNGYPFHISNRDLTLGSRIMAVADVFTALTEDRPYRKGMKAEDALKVLNNMVETVQLDGKIVTMLGENLKAVNEVRRFAQNEAREKYQKFDSELEAVTNSS
jgi:HD-GYP domain-containing protein (c-di-GMP phosphodiesterase class II)